MSLAFETRLRFDSLAADVDDRISPLCPMPCSDYCIFFRRAGLPHARPWLPPPNRSPTASRFAADSTMKPLRLRLYGVLMPLNPSSQE